MATKRERQFKSAFTDYSVKVREDDNGVYAEDDSGCERFLTWEIALAKAKECILREDARFLSECAPVKDWGEVS